MRDATKEPAIELRSAARLELFAAATQHSSTTRALRELARLRRLPLRLIATRAGLPAWRVERVLNGRIQPHEGELERIAAALGVQAGGEK